MILTKQIRAAVRKKRQEQIICPGRFRFYAVSVSTVLYLFRFDIAVFQLLVHECSVLSVHQVMDKACEKVNEYNCNKGQQDGKRRDAAPAEHLEQQQRNNENEQKMRHP